ncbi:copia-type polyprotein [Cucumis melo var. makuwa]|uniref:Copia-type polyprotein n=1 Tax=Cucumis melo var. makuwa TaxID=1194695 RepID=A0A5D3BMQ7_CUCMM|nr:copia-type polyprotein [Cucumis melo var. makuwa]
MTVVDGLVWTEGTRLICASFESTRLICASLGITRLIGVSFGITRLICAFYGTTRLLCRVRAQRGADRREAGRMREGHMDASGFLYASADVFFIDMQLQESNNRFTEKSTELLLCVACLNPSNSFTAFDRQKLICLAQFYPRDFSTTELLILEDQLQNYIIDVCSDNMFVGLTSIGDLSQKMVITAKDKVYPLVYRLLTLALILPVTMATVERTFSAMSIIKTQLRNRMEDQWMNDCLVAYIERDLFDKIDNENSSTYDSFISPQQNGVVERKNRTIFNMARSMLQSKKMPKEFWTQVVECEVYLSNCSPARSLWNKIPQQAWRGRKPSIAHLRVFGCIAYVHIPDKKCSKLDEKSEKHVFVGYNARSKDYKLYNPVTKKAMVSKDVVFDEEASWNWNDEPEDYKFLFFLDDHDEPSDIASPSTPPTSPITS